MIFKMNLKKSILILITILIVGIPILLVSLNSSGKFADYGTASHTLGQIAGLTGMTLFALTFILSTRAKFIEDAFNGLDKVYGAHGVLGASAFILILFHPLLLVLRFIPEKIDLAAKYLLPHGALSINFGIIALVGMIILICLTIYSNIKYNRWKFSHEFLGAVFILAALHIFLVRGTASQDNIFGGYYIYAIVISLIGLIGFVYNLLLRNKIAPHKSYQIKSVNKLTNCIYEIILSPEKEQLRYKSGQFVFVKFKNKIVGKEPHPFSLASSSNNPLLRIIVKNLGDFTGSLDNLRVGDKVNVEGPYGRFNYKRHGREQIWIAGGIGITPFIGMAEDLMKNKSPQSVELYYTAKTKEDLVCINELKEIESKTANFKVIPWVSNEKGYLTAKEITKGKNLNSKDFFICGPEKLKQDITSGLINLGIKKDKINQEEFGFR